MSTNSPTTRSEEVAAELRDEILRGRYRAGERLPSERDLAVRFATARGTVREALKKLEQLGIASIQPGGARVVAVELCTLDVLGPLLDLHDIPDPELVDQVLQMFGVLLEVAARSAVERASDADLAAAQAFADEILANEGSNARQHEALRNLAHLFVEVADHLVLRLMINGLSTTFWARMQTYGIRPELDGRAQREIVEELRGALNQRSPGAVGKAMRRLNRVFRDSAREALRKDLHARRKSA